MNYHENANTSQTMLTKFTQFCDYITEICNAITTDKNTLGCKDCCTNSNTLTYSLTYNSHNKTAVYDDILSGGAHVVTLTVLQHLYIII